MLDENGYRYNVGIIIINDRKQVFGQKGTVRMHGSSARGNKKGSPSNLQCIEN